MLFSSQIHPVAAADGSGYETRYLLRTNADFNCTLSAQGMLALLRYSFLSLQQLLRHNNTKRIQYS